MKMGKAGKLFFFKVNVCEMGAEFGEKRSTEYGKEGTESRGHRVRKIELRLGIGTTFDL
jgi:hypothetical protein